MIWLTLRLVLILSDGIIIIIFLVVQELKHDLTHPTLLQLFDWSHPSLLQVEWGYGYFDFVW